MSNVVDLNKAKGRKLVEFSLDGKIFRILRVVTGVRQMYADYIHRQGELMEKADTLDKIEGETDEDYAVRVEPITREIEAFAAEKNDLYYRMLELILTKNGHTFDRQWWEENTDEFDQQQFVQICLTKDAPSQKKKTTGADSIMKN